MSSGRLLWLRTAMRGYMHDVAATARKACCRGLSSVAQPFDVSTQQWRVHLDQYLCDMSSWTCASRDLTWLLREELLYLQDQVSLQSHHLMQLADTNASLERRVADLQHQVDVLVHPGTCSANSEGVQLPPGPSSPRADESNSTEHDIQARVRQARRKARSRRPSPSPLWTPAGTALSGSQAAGCTQD